jgi:hypothetical protein
VLSFVCVVYRYFFFINYYYLAELNSYGVFVIFVVVVVVLFALITNAIYVNIMFIRTFLTLYFFHAQLIKLLFLVKYEQKF